MYDISNSGKIDCEDIRQVLSSTSLDDGEIDEIVGDTKTLDLSEYADLVNINQSQIFHSLIKVLFEQLPCVPDFLKAKEKYEKRKAKLSKIKSTELKKADFDFGTEIKKE